MTKEPKSAADPRPNNEPYYRDSTCDECGGGLAYLHEVEPEAYTEEEHEDEAYFFDEFICTNRDCDSGIFMDWPESEFDRLVERMENFDEEDAVSLEELEEKLGLEE